MNGTANLDTVMSHLGAWIHIFGFSAIVIAGGGFYAFHAVKHKFSPAAQMSAVLGVLMAAVIVWYLPSLIGASRNSAPGMTGINPNSTGSYGMSSTIEPHPLDILDRPTT